MTGVIIHLKTEVATVWSSYTFRTLCVSCQVSHFPLTFPNHWCPNAGGVPDDGDYSTYPVICNVLTSGKAWKSLVKDCVWWVVLGWSLSWPYLRLARRFRFSCHRCRWFSSEVSSNPKNSRVSFFMYLPDKTKYISNAE